VSDDERLMETGRLAELGLQASTLVHELRQPVFAIKAMAQVVAQGAEGETAEQLNSLIAQVEVLEGLLERYLDSSKRPTGATIPVDLGLAVAAGVQVVRGHRSGIALDIHAPARAQMAQVDPIAVQQITSNLVRNALDAASSRVEVRVDNGVLTVRDDGPGIRPDIEERLCEPFVTSKPPGEGTGLGLAVTRSLVEAIGGRFSWETSSAGTCFQVEFADGRRKDEP